jgi:tetratricopeptide (TPR) repeat protein
MPGQGRRIAAYAAAALLVGGLVTSSLCVRAEADVGTLLSSASVHIQLADALPDDRSKGTAVRERLLAQAEEFLTRAEQQAPGSTDALEVRAFLACTRGRWDEALRAYSEVLDRADCGAERAAAVRLNRARVHLRRGRPGDVLAELGDAGFSDAHRTSARLLTARALAAAGRTAEARELAVEIGSGGDTAASLEAGQILEELGEHHSAAAAYRRAGNPPATADYFVARLKARAEEFDTACELLERAIEADRTGVLRLVQRDRELWSKSLGSERLSRLTTSSEAAPPATR